MKNLRTAVMTFAKGLLSVVLMTSMVTACYDDSALWAEIEDINTKLDDLEESLNNQIQVLNDLLAGGDITISECTANADGTYRITLSNGKSFSVFPQDKTLKGLVSTMDINGVDYWAMYNEAGVLTPIKDSEGKNITVASVIPTVEKRDGAYYLIVGDNEYVTGYEEEVAVITSYEINRDDSGNVYSVSFTFGEEALTFTVPMANYKGFSFVLGDGITSSKTIKELYVANGESYKITGKLDGVVDYVPQLPAGWDMKEDMDEINGLVTLTFTAPSVADVESGAAVASGYVKVVAVLEDGKAMIAKLLLTTDPFKAFTVTTTNAIIEKQNGVDKFLYGVVAFEDFDQEALFETANDVLADQEADGVASSNVNALLTELLGGEIVPDTPYVLWAIPAAFSQDEDDAACYVKDGVIRTLFFGGTALKLSVDKVTFNNAIISFNLQGEESYYAGVALKSDSVLDDILYSVNNKLVDPVTEPMTYEGSAFGFPSAKANETVKPVSKSTYVSWVVPVSDAGEYVKDNIVYQEFTLTDVTPGGATVVETQEATIDRVSIEVPVSSENASRIYYVFITESQASRVSASKRADYLLRNGHIIDYPQAVLEANELSPGATYTLFAMSVDSEGRYGEVTKQEYTTLPLVYNNLAVEAVVTEVGQNTAKATISVTGGEAVDYIYWVGRSTDKLWVLGGDTNAKKVEYIQKRLALYPDDSEFQRIKYNNPIENGVLSMNNLKGETEHHIVILAKDSEGKFSKAKHVMFTTLAIDLGTVVVEGSSEWELAKSQIDIKWNQNQFVMTGNSDMPAYYSFEIKCPSNLTAYILCMSENYFVENPDTQTPEDRIIDIEAQCSRPYDADYVPRDQNDEYIQEPDWTDDNGELHIGTLLNVYDFYVHGYPTNGFATYFAADSHKMGNCTAWDNGSCGSYNNAVESIAKRRTLEFYKDHVIRTRGSYCKTQATINQVAQDLYEAYLPYYQNAQPLIYINDGSYLHMEQHYASGPDDEGNVVDDVFVVLKDAQGNYYHPMKFDVPNYFE